MSQIMILYCDWLSERPLWRYLARSGLPDVSHKKNFPESHTDQTCSVNNSYTGSPHDIQVVK